MRVFTTFGQSGTVTKDNEENLHTPQNSQKFLILAMYLTSV